MLKNKLLKELDFKPPSLERMEVWAIPYGFTREGIDNVILTGDAAGFCNAFPGEGIRLAIESSIAVGDAVPEVIHGDQYLEPTYRDQVEWITRLVPMMHEFVLSLMDEDREKSIKSERNRT